ncbi:hypothetical protein WR25_02189 [Diploscapter pachys]|uniref:Polyprenyl synthetase n=1 Tax=Diploscapter pachys TaxID=2018661 RepID=A0A2A2J9F6_9BILA|nr:hypothetical protein WR25_02189 [Diploscapter pachys]
MNLNSEVRTGEYISEDDSEDEKHLLAPFDHIKSCTGIEAKLTALKAVNKWLLIDEQMLNIAEMLGYATLMIDDIEDNSILRKGSPVAHSIFGIARTLNTCNYLYFVVMKKVSELGHPEAIKLFLGTFIILMERQLKMNTKIVIFQLYESQISKS